MEKKVPRWNLLHIHKHLQICNYSCEDRAERYTNKMMNEVKTLLKYY